MRAAALAALLLLAAAASARRGPSPPSAPASADPAPAPGPQSVGALAAAGSLGERFLFSTASPPAPEWEADDEEEEGEEQATVDGGQWAEPGDDGRGPPHQTRTQKVLSDPRVDPASLSDKKGSFAVYGRYCGPGWTDKWDRPGIDTVDEACHQHDSCYGAAWAVTAKGSASRAGAECKCDGALMKTLRAWKADESAADEADPDAKRTADEILGAFPVKCPGALALSLLPHKKGAVGAPNGG